MRIGCCTNMIAADAGKTGVEYVAKLAKLGFDYIELPLAEMTALPEEAFSGLVERVKRSGIRCEACNNFFPKTIRLTGEHVNDAEVDLYVEKALTRAGALGVECVVFGSGPAKNVPEGFPMEQGYRQVADLLRRIAPVAERQGITIVIEPLRKAECNLINSFAEGCGLAKDVARENVKVLVDYYHLCQENESIKNISDYGARYLRHVHFARNEGRGYPADMAEDSRYPAFFAALEAAGYERRISLEAYTGDFDTEAPAALKLLRKQEL